MVYRAASAAPAAPCVTALPRQVIHGETHLKSGEDELRDEDEGHGVEETQASGEGDEEEREEPPSGDLGDTGDPVGQVILGVHCYLYTRTR